jgi:hypothetical protein
MRNEYALIHCLDIERETIVELQNLTKLSKNEDLTILQDLINNDDKSLDKDYVSIKEFFEFIEKLKIIIEENEQLKIESM